MRKKLAVFLAMTVAGLARPSTPERKTPGYMFADRSPEGAFATMSEQMEIAASIFRERGAHALALRFSYFTGEDRKQLERAFGNARDARTAKLLFGPKEIRIDETVIGMKGSELTLNGQVYKYNLSMSFDDNLVLIRRILAAKVSRIERILNFLLLPVADAGMVIEDTSEKKVNASWAALVARAHRENRELTKDDFTPEIEKRAYNGTNTHLSAGAREAGQRNYLETRAAGNGPSPEAIEEAYQASLKHQSEIKNPQFMVVVDYSKCRNEKSFFVVNRQTREVVRSYELPTAYGSTDGARMCTRSCSDQPKSGQSEGGSMITKGSWGQGGHSGEGISLAGLDPDNKNTESREIKIHEGGYLLTGGNSAGCMVLTRDEIEDIKAFIPGDGTFVYGANCPNKPKGANFT